MNKKNDFVHVPVRIIETKNDDVARSSIEMKNNQVVMKERSYSNTKEPDVDAGRTKEKHLEEARDCHPRTHCKAYNHRWLMA